MRRATIDRVTKETSIALRLALDGKGRYDVRTGIETPIRHIPHLIGEMLDIEPIVNLVPRQHDDVAKYEMNGTPRVGTPFAEGLRKAVDWYEKNPVTDTYSHLRIGAQNAS